MKSLFLMLLLLILVFGCISQAPVEEKQEITIQEKIENTIFLFNENNKSSFNSVEDLVDLGPKAIPYLLKTLEKNDTYSKWASIYALSRIGYYQDEQTRTEIISKLKQEFENEAISIRIMAAGTAVTFGDKSGIPILIEGLQNREMLMLTEPPQLICQYSYTTLSHYINLSYGSMCGWDYIDPIVYVNWKAWWDQNKDSIFWNDTAKVYEL